MKNLLPAIAFACLATPVFSQFHIGLSGGGNMSYWTWEVKSPGTSIDYEPAMGWRTVAFGEWQMNSLLGFRAEFGTQMKANKMIENFIFETDLLAGDLDGTKWVFREFYQFYEGSFLVQVSPIKKCRQVYLLAGGTAGWLALGWKTTKGSEAHIKHSSKSFIYLKDPSWNRNAFAADFGLGGNIPLGVNSKIKVEARYQHSLSNLSNYENVDASISSLLFNVGYLHRL